MGSTERAGESHISHGHGSALSMIINEVAPTDGSTGPEVAGYQKTTCDLGNKYFLYHNRPRVVLQSGLTFVKQ